MNMHSIEEVEDHSDRAPVLAVRHGRGRTGGSTFLDLLIQRARRAGRSVIIGDGDRERDVGEFFIRPAISLAQSNRAVTISPMLAIGSRR